ncbi:MAG TPA: RHS repeat-associated core domain-containing protein [Candidatus Dormibacteraeota bacterium]|nr:RHS repeat-associated core domain-containing protein [Candidatus Dormibacteraeota bacterium]
MTLPTGGTISYTWGTVGLCSSPLALTKVSRGVISRTIDANDGNGPRTWTYSNAVTDPDGNDTVHTVTDLGGCALYETQTQWYQGSQFSGTLLKTVKTDYTSSQNPYFQYIFPAPQVNVHPIRVTTIWPNGLTSKEEMTYDSAFVNSTGNFSYGTVTSRSEFDYAMNAPGSLIRTTSTAFLSQSNSTYLTANLLDLASSKTITNSAGTQIAKSTYSYDGSGLQPSGITTQHDNTKANAVARGNRTSSCSWNNVTGGSLCTTTTYFDTGLPYRVTDPNGNTTQFDYSSTYIGAYVTQTTLPVTGSVQHIISGTYDFNSGKLTSFTDQNSKTSNYLYDALWRITSASFPDTGQLVFSYPNLTTIEKKRQITSTLWLDLFSYYDGLGRIKQTQLVSDPDGTTFVDTTYDKLGRVYCVSNPYRSFTDSTYGITTHVYDALGRATAIQPPDYWANTSASSPTCQNVTSSTTPANPTNYVSTSYTANTTTVTDQAGKSRKSVSDGLARLTQVFEDPAGLNYETDYTYDVLGNLLTVNQKGGSTNSTNWRTRAFTYDSLSRLLTAANPESGSITYAYDSDGNLITKTSPAPNQTGSSTVTIAYCYDALNRLTSKAYTTSTTCPQTAPVASYSYDQTTFNGLTITNGIGRRTGMTDQAGNGFEAWSYESMGRVASEKRTVYTGTNSYSKTIPYTYNLDGSLASIATPSWPDGSHPIMNTYTPGGAGRSTALNSTLINNVHYTASGALCYMQENWGMGFTTTNSFNNRLQPATIYAVGQTAGHGTAPAQCASVPLIPNDAYTSNMVRYTYSFTDANGHNNGNVSSITDGLTANYSQTYTYDSLNRISTTQTTANHSQDAANCWAESYSYDPWGNLLKLGLDTIGQSGFVGCTRESGFDFTNFTGTNNRITATGYAYDSAGNLITNPGVGTQTFDTENRLVSAGGVTYTYDGDGKRIMKSNGTIYWYGMNSDALMETDLTNTMKFAFQFFAGRRVARLDAANSNAVQWYFADHLGTSRTVYSLSGIDRCDYYPFGGERCHSTVTTNRYKFTGKERDSESGLDDFDARFYSSSMGRFTIPDWTSNAVDVPYADFGNPQSLNLYTYVKNNPLNLTDVDGHGPGDALQIVEILNRFADNPVGFTKSFLIGVLKQETANVRENVGASPSPVLEPTNDVERAGAAVLNAAAQTTTAVAPFVSGDGEESAGGTAEVEPSMGSVRGAQRESMRQENIPTSQQPDTQVSTNAGRQYTYTVPKKGGGTETKIVTRQNMDRNHGKHVEAGKPKANGQTDPSGRLRHSNDKTKVVVK